MRRVAIAAAALLGLSILLYLPSCAEPVDAVAELERESGVPLASRRVPTNGIELHVVEAGPPSGAPVVLLHGFPEFWLAWQGQIPRLARAGFRVLAPDQRGYNASDKPPEVFDYRMEALEADVIGLLDHLGVERAHLAGHDVGAWVAWHLAIEHPERFRSLVIFNAAHPQAVAEEPEDTVGWHRELMRIPWLPQLVARPGNWWLVVSTLRDTARTGTFPDSRLRAYRYAWHRDGAMEAMAKWNRAGRRHPRELPERSVVRVPTRLVWGRQDPFMEYGRAAPTLELLERGELVEVPDAGHWLLHEEPERTSELLIGLFRRVDADAAAPAPSGEARDWPLPDA